MQISYLAEYPKFVPTLASGLLEQWLDHARADPRRSHRKLEAYLSRDSLPIA